MGVSYEDEEIRVYSSRSYDEEEHYEPGFQPYDDDAFYDDDDIDDEYIGDVFAPAETSFDEIESRAALREIEKKINYTAIDTDENEGLYRSMSDGDIELVIGFGQHLRDYGVLEDHDNSIEASTEVTYAEMFAGASDAAMSDEEINPDVYSVDYEDVIQEALAYDQEHDNDEEMMSFERSAQEYARFASGNGLDDQDSDQSVESEVFNFDEEEPESIPGRASKDISVLSKTLFHAEDYEAAADRQISAEKAVIKDAGSMSVDDVLMLTKLFAVEKLSDKDIADIVTSLSENEVAELRAELRKD